ncbi:putative ureidoglycolate hydrolase [Sarocladium strictum]
MITIQSENVRITAEPLTQEAFAPFGDVVANPRPDIHPSAFASYSESLPFTAVSANQGSAIQYRSASRIRNLLNLAPSKRSEPIMSVFVCAARPLEKARNGDEEFTVSLVERHPFTTQTFTPLASSASSYLVIVAPSLPPSPQDEGLPAPTGNGLPGRGLPDVKNMKAFIATNRQAVTYGAGTWHSPMVALGDEGTTLDFVVSQFASGVAEEDCQLVDFSAAPVVRLRTRMGKL